MEMEDFAAILIRWYSENKRRLPWRETEDPYRIWISEIILQQTRVAQGLEYFNRFMERFPDVASLAQAGEDEVMKYWQGLGYYSRARNLHAAAREIMERYEGVFPSEYEKVRALKGIGEYTAAAVCSFAWRQPYAVVDGNVYRVLGRVFGIDTPIDSGPGKKEFAELATALLDRQRPDIYNQAIMDFGAIQCTPKAPDCLYCPLREHCVAFATGKVAQLPVKEGKTRVKPRYFNYLHIGCQGKTLLKRRNAKDIWQNLYEYPLIETASAVDFSVLERSYFSIIASIVSKVTCLSRFLNVPNIYRRSSLLSLKTTRLQGTLIPTFPPPQNKSTNLSISCGKWGSIWGRSLYFPPV